MEYNRGRPASGVRGHTTDKTRQDYRGGWIKQHDYVIIGKTRLKRLSVSKTAQKWLNLVRFSSILQDSLKFCKILHDSAKFSKILQDSVRFFFFDWVGWAI